MKLLVTGAWKFTPEDIEKLKELGHEVSVLQMETDPLPTAYEDVEGVICNGLFLSHPIENFTNLRYIQLTSAGYDRVPMDYVKAHGIEIHNARGVYSIPMAEFAISGVLRIYKQSAFFRENQKRHKWEKHRGLRELNGKTVCIIGCGDVGGECAKRFEAFGCRVIGVNRTVKEIPHFSAVYPLEDIDCALKQSDIAVITLALTDATRHLINSERLALLKSDAVLVNISRGAVVDTKALINWLNANPASGAVLDVFEEEPLSENSPLWDMENVILTPHNSFVGDGNEERMNSLIYEVLK